MKDVAARAGVSIGTLYRNFPTRDDLVIAMYLGCKDGFFAVFEAARVIEDPIEALKFVFRGGFSVKEQSGEMMEAIHRGLPPSCAARLELPDFEAAVEDLLARGVASGALRSDLDVSIATAQLLTSFHSPQYSQLREARSCEQIADAYLDLFLRATRAG